MIERGIAIEGGYVLADPGGERIGTKNNIGRINRPLFFTLLHARSMRLNIGRSHRNTSR